jgi:tetratricopeptide (TPR) repeat protein
VLAEEGAAGLAALLIFAGVATWALARGSRTEGERGRSAQAAMLGSIAVGLHALVETPFEAPAIPMTLLALAWKGVAPHRRGEAAAAFDLHWPDRRREPLQARLVLVSCAITLVVVYLLSVAAPYLSHEVSLYAQAPGRSPARVDFAARLAEGLNPHQPYLGYRRARAALGRAPRVSPPLLANAASSLEHATRLAPGDPPAYLLLGELYARAASDLPGAGPGARAAAERYLSVAIRLAPWDARARVERASLKLSRGDTEGAVRDCDAAVNLEPNALPAHHLRLEAQLAIGRGEAAAGALQALEAALQRLRGHQPQNGYEASLMRLDRVGLERARERLRSLALLVPAGDLLGGGSGGDLGGRPLGEDLIEEGLLRRTFLGRLPVPVGMGVHAGLADDGLHLALDDRLHRMVEDQLAARAVVVENFAESWWPVRHEEIPVRRRPIYRVCPLGSNREAAIHGPAPKSECVRATLELIPSRAPRAGKEGPDRSRWYTPPSEAMANKYIRIKEIGGRAGS